MPQDGLESESFTIISVDFFFDYENNDYLQVDLDTFAYKIASK